jgi:hypothetical protein
MPPFHDANILPQRFSLGLCVMTEYPVSEFQGPSVSAIRIRAIESIEMGILGEEVLSARTLLELVAAVSISIGGKCR